MPHPRTDAEQCIVFSAAAHRFSIPRYAPAPGGGLGGVGSTSCRQRTVCVKVCVAVGCGCPQVTAQAAQRGPRGTLAAAAAASGHALSGHMDDRNSRAGTEISHIRQQPACSSRAPRPPWVDRAPLPGERRGWASEAAGGGLSFGLAALPAIRVGVTIGWTGGSSCPYSTSGGGSLSDAHSGNPGRSRRCALSLVDSRDA